MAGLLDRSRARQVERATINDAVHVVRGRLRDSTNYQAAYPPGFASKLTVRLLAGGADV